MVNKQFKKNNGRNKDITFSGIKQYKQSRREMTCNVFFISLGRKIHRLISTFQLSLISQLWRWHEKKRSSDDEHIT